MKVWLYLSRKEEPVVYTGDSDGFARARAQQDSDNRVSFEKVIEEGILEFDGSEELGSFWIEDGGDITLLEVQ